MAFGGKWQVTLKPTRIGLPHIPHSSHVATVTSDGRFTAGPGVAGQMLLTELAGSRPSTVQVVLSGSALNRHNGGRAIVLQGPLSWPGTARLTAVSGLATLTMTKLSAGTGLAVGPVRR